MPVDQMTLYGIGAVPAVIGLVQVVREAGVPSRFLPLCSIALGIAAGVLQQFALPHPVIEQGIVVGVAVGLSASGLWAGVKSMATANDTPPVPPASPPLVTP